MPGRLQAVSARADDRLVSNDRAPVRVTHLIHDLRSGGAEHVLVDLASIAAEEGMAMSVVSMRPLARFRYAKQLHDSGVRVESLELGAWWDPRGTARLRRLLPELRPDVLHSHLKHADVVAGRVAKAASIPHVSTLHMIEDSVGWFAARKRDFAMRSRLRTARRTIAVSDAVRDWYLDASGADPGSVVTVHNGVPDAGNFDDVEVAAARAEFGVADDTVLAVMVAVMRPGKGHDVLFDALPHLAKGRVEFLLVGDGPELGRLQERAAGRADVVFTGFRDDVARLLAAADFVVHPSLGDALPTALVHALAAGRPIVASAVGGIPEIVPVDAGELIARGSPRALAAAIDRVAADAVGRGRMGKRARDRYDEEFSATMWARRLHAVYAALLGRGAH